MIAHSVVATMAAVVALAAAREAYAERHDSGANAKGAAEDARPSRAVQAVHTEEAARAAHADEGAPQDETARAGHVDETALDASCAPERPRDPLTTTAGTAAALLPGAIVHGTGHLVVGDTKTGLRLLALEGAGLGVLATGFVPIVLSGASRRLIGPAAALSAAGVGLFAISFLADIYGVVAPTGGFGAPLLVAPTLETSIGYRYVYDPTFSYRHFMAQEVDYRAGHWRLHPSAWFAFDDANSRLRAHVAYRLTGPLPRGNPRAYDGSFVDLEAALTRHSFPREGFNTTTGEFAVAGRLDMDHVGPSLRGSFAEMSAGIGLQAYSYARHGTKADVGELLLFRFGYGIYLGFAGAPRGEIRVYYDHRHDDFAAGLKIPGLGSGVAGHFGSDARLFVTSQWGVAAEAAVGSAYIIGTSVLFRYGGE